MSSRLPVLPLVLVPLLTAFLLPLTSFGLTLDFESLNDSDTVTNQFAGNGVLFSNTVALTAGVSLNEIEFPPKSGITVVSDNSGPIILAFSAPFLNAGGYFTYFSQLTLSAFDGNGNLLATKTSAFSSNLALSGDNGSSPNEFLQISGVGLIHRLQISGDPNGGSFVLDDFQATPQTTVIPEPGTALLLCTGLLGFWLYQVHTARVRNRGPTTP